jgi:hypothetical protein
MPKNIQPPAEIMNRPTMISNHQYQLVSPPVATATFVSSSTITGVAVG